MAGYAYGSRHDWDGSLDAAGHDSIYPDPSNPDPLTCPIDDAGYETDVERFIVDRTGRKDEFGGR